MSNYDLSAFQNSLMNWLFNSKLTGRTNNPLLATPADPKEAQIKVPHDGAKRINYQIMKQKIYPLLSSRVSLMTGRYPYQSGNTVLSRAITVPEVMGVPNGGYTCLLCEG